jgi:hypothetical protein
MPGDAAGWIKPVVGGCVLRLWVGPSSSRPGVAGVRGDALRVRVTAPPAEGAANRALLRLLADLLGLRPADLILEAGAGGRQKRVRVRGLRVEDVRARLASVLSVDTPAGDN